MVASRVVLVSETAPAWPLGFLPALIPIYFLVSIFTMGSRLVGMYLPIPLVPLSYLEVYINTTLPLHVMWEATCL